ncbi:M23 family metallopeptidase [Actinomadura rudentiformis]|uniref:M23 family metallopeptidase n=1 Tax=Actinomadura rudentiformis TaxID=359158 RepID=A0A6H9YVU9_9ACTN|nr:M23 family metallopeptidase [Actinomadura rudentiformis]KAB2344133.1 M23 family metallopeptidase [Actinomadura rudentiformis]
MDRKKAKRLTGLLAATALPAVALTLETAPALAAVPEPGVSIAASTPKFQLPFACGTKVRISTGPTHDDNGPGGRQKALDMYDPPKAGTTVVAAYGGTVKYDSDQSTNTIWVKHRDGWASMYSHMSGRVKNGTKVKRGQKIGKVDNEGTGAKHLHYELHHKGKIVHPRFNGRTYKLSAPGQPWSKNLVSHNCSKAKPTIKCRYSLRTDAAKHSWKWTGKKNETEGTLKRGKTVTAGYNGELRANGDIYKRVLVSGGADNRGPWVIASKLKRIGQCWDA